jgi:hypothetical protein
MDGGVLDDLIASATSLGTLLLAVGEWDQVSDMHTHAECVKPFLYVLLTPKPCRRTSVSNPLTRLPTLQKASTLGFCISSRQHEQNKNNELGSIASTRTFKIVLFTPLHTYPGVVGVDGLATKEGVDPKMLSRGVGVAPDVQDGALLEVVHVPSLHFQGTLFTAPFFDVSNLTPSWYMFHTNQSL